MISKIILTEGLLYRRIDISANLLEMIPDFVVRNAKHSQAVVFEKSRSFGVIFYGFCFSVLGAVQLNNEFCFGTVEIHNEFPYHLLPQKADRIAAQKNRTIGVALLSSFSSAALWQKAPVLCYADTAWQSLRHGVMRRATSLYTREALSGSCMTISSPSRSISTKPKLS